MRKRSNNRTNQPPEIKIVPEIKVVTDESTGIRHAVSYDVRTTSQGYANIAGILAGFAFTVIILIVSTTGTSNISNYVQDIVTIGFLISFFCCIMSCFAFSVIASQEALTPRANFMALFAGIGFSTATSFIFWGLAIILKASLSNNVAFVANQIFSIFVLSHPVYIATSVLHNIYIFDFRQPKLGEFLIVLTPSYLILAVGLFLRISGFYLDIQVVSSYFIIIIWASLIVAVISNLITVLSCTSIKAEYRLKLWVGGIAIGLQSCILGLLILSL